LPPDDELHSLKHNDELRQKQKFVSSTTRSSVSNVDISTESIGASACNDENMYVEKSNVKSIKQNYCYFCLKLQTQLPRHLETVHCNEPQVKKFAILPKGNPKRKKIINIIRKKGNFKFNTISEINNAKLMQTS